MEGIESFQVCLKDICDQAGILAEAAVSLSKSFVTEADRLTRQDGAQRLKVIHAAVIEKLEELRHLESAASYGYSKANLTLSVVGSIAKIIVSATTENQQARKFVNDVFADTDKKQPYGRVMVCVGPRGVPDGVQAVSISELARESNRSESEIISKLRGSEHLLFTEDVFSRLIDRLINDVQEGRLLLPILPDKLSEIQSSSGAKLEEEKPVWVRISPP